jgi:cysteine desulfurase / selenocysteine lyase
MSVCTAAKIKEYSVISVLREREFPLIPEYTYLNTATQGPLPTSTRLAIEQAALHAQYPGLKQAPSQGEVAEVVRTRLANMLRVSADDFAFMGNTTSGLNLCANGIAWQPGDNLVLPDHEFPSVIATWLNLRALGVEVRLVPWNGSGPSVDELMAAVDSRTRVVSCSAVAWDTGYFMDLEELGKRCLAVGCLLIVDGIQAVGALDMPLNLPGIAAVSFHGYKWLLADFGVGMTYIAPHAIEHIRPTTIGEQALAEESLDPISHEPSYPFVWKAGARRYAAGGSNMLGLAALASSLGLIEQIGMAAIDAHNRDLAELLVKQLTRLPNIRLVSSADAARRSTLTVFTLGDAARDAALVQQLAERRMIVAHRRRGVRVSPHWFNTADEIEQLVRAVAALL